LRKLIALAAITLGIIAVARYRAGREGWKSARKFVADFDVSLRRPDDAATIDLVPSADLAADVVADIALQDALGTVRLGDASPELRERWLRAIGHVDEELAAARAVSLDALATRPGWAGHWSMVGKLVYAAQRRGVHSPAADEARLWQMPLAIAMASFPGDDSTAVFASTAYLETWPELSETGQNRARQGFRRALLDPAFASNAFPVLMEAVGHDQAIAMMPSEASTLRAAFESLARGSDVGGATALYSRWELAEWRSRVADLREIEIRAGLNDVTKQRDLAFEWMARHQAADFDTAAGREQLLRVLALAVNDRIGSWQSDSRANIVRFFLNHRISPERKGSRGLEIAPGAAGIAAATNALTGVPEPIRARVRLLGGDIDGAQAIFERSDTVGSFEWTPFLLDLAEFRLMQAATEPARNALEALAPAARGECDALVVARKLARLAGATLREEAAAQRFSGNPPAHWSASGVLTLCVDPDLSDTQQLQVTFDAQEPALVSWGWNDGRHATFVAPAGHTAMDVPLAGRAGRNSFFLKTLAGKSIIPGQATVSSP
jgi:hypothetical protein